MLVIIVSSKLAQQCQEAAQVCYWSMFDELTCIRDYIKDSGQKFCNTSRFNLLITSQSGEVAYYGYGAEIVEGMSMAYCTAYCVGN